MQSFRFGLLGVLLMACGGDAAPECKRGDDQCACLANRQCNGSLRCVTGTCFDLGTVSTSTATSSRKTQSTRASSSSQAMAGTSAKRPDAADEPESQAQAIDAGTARPQRREPSHVTPGSSSAAANCAPPGAACDRPCCGSALCISDVCAGPCTSNEECESRCCTGGVDGICSSTDLCFPDGVTPEVLSNPVCAGPGGNCSDAWCCSGPCISDSCATRCSKASDCESGCCRAFSNGAVCAPSTLCAGHVTGGGVASDANIAIERCPGPLTLIADDGTFLGQAASNETAVDGICNEFSSYGGEYGTDSIFNDYGTYGSDYSQQSAYNEYTSTPPYLFCATTNTKLNPVSKNMYRGRSIDPDVLCTVLAANGY